MPNIFKKSTALWILLTLAAPFILIPALPLFWRLGIYFSAPHICLISIPYFGFRAYRSYRQGSAPELAGATAADIPTTAQVTRVRPQPLSGAPYLLGASLGLGGGYLTRPTFLGQKVPLQILTARVDETFVQVRDKFIAHLAIAAGIGVIMALALRFLIASLRKA